jgi:hypothetical protein
MVGGAGPPAVPGVPGDLWGCLAIIDELNGDIEVLAL